jgi:hypothetical protein
VSRMMTNGAKRKEEGGRVLIAGGVRPVGDYCVRKRFCGAPYELLGSIVSSCSSS